jgi:uncharacterized repeat protein (TIGR03943 family)
MNPDTESLLLLLLGGAVLRISLDDTFLRYVKGWTRPYLVAGATVLIVLALVSLWRENAAGRRGSGDHDGRGHRGPLVAWLLLLPVFAIFLVAPPALGSYAAARASNDVVQPRQSEFPPLAAGDPVTTTLTDYATRAVWDQGRSLRGRRVRLVGFVSPRPAGGVYLVRLVITCCAADARPIKITVRGAPGGLSADTWVEVVGEYAGLDTAAGRSAEIPVIKAESVHIVSAPAEPYES